MAHKVYIVLIVMTIILSGCRKSHKRTNSSSEGDSEITKKEIIDNTSTERSVSLDSNPSNEDNIQCAEYVVVACNYLNEIRRNPSAFSRVLGVDLNSVKPRQSLKLNQHLIKAAQDKANSMATQNYFSHVDLDGNGMNIRIKDAGYEIPAEWYADPSQNYFESLGAGVATSKEVIDLLIIDKGTPSLGHRNHLLGINDFHSNCEDMGVGYAYNPNSKYKHYWCILIAKHNY